MDKKKTNIMDWLVILTVVIFLFEVLLQGPDLLIFLLLFGAGVYYGRKRLYRLKGKLIFWGSLVMLVITIMNTAAFRFLVVTVVLYLLYRWYQTRKNPSRYQPSFMKDSWNKAGTAQPGAVLTNKWFGRQQTAGAAYAWEDVNIQSGIGDTVIDLNYTVLPKDGAVIFIRKIAGNVQVIVPYEVEVSLQHSVVLGSVEVFDYRETGLVNRTVHYETEHYREAKQKVKIFTSVLAGKIEVKRV